MKKSQNFKFKLNFHVRDLNLDLQKRNFVLYRTAVISIVIFLIVLSPVFAYFSILYNNVNLELYFKAYPVISQHLDLPSKVDIIGTIWASFGLVIFAIIFLIFFKPLITMDGMTRTRQLLVIIGVVLTMVLALLLAALSQYFYAQYEAFFNYESATVDNKQDWIRDLSDRFTENWKNGVDLYSWQGSTVVWWVMFFQLSVIFATTVFLQNSVFSKNELLGIEQYINYSIKYQSLNRSRWTRKIGQLFKISDKNLSVWLLVITFLIMLPNFAYAILISVKGTSINALINWTYSVPNLLQDHEGVESFNQLFAQFFSSNSSINANYFLLNSMPIILMGITFSTTFFFVSIMVRGWKNTPGAFIVQYVALSVEIIVLFSFFLYTKLEVQFLYVAWSSPLGLDCFAEIQQIASSQGSLDLEAIKKLYPVADVIGKQFGYMDWWSEYEIIAEAIIGSSFAICSLLGVAVGMFRSEKIANDYRNQEKSLFNLTEETNHA